MHQISFSIAGGRNDILKVKFTKFQPGTQVFFAAGVNFLDAQGLKIADPENTTLNVNFPNSIYLVVEHVDSSSVGPFAFEFWYLDQDTNEAKEDVIDGYRIEVKEVKGK